MTAVKTPKEEYTIPTGMINNQLPILEKATLLIPQ